MIYTVERFLQKNGEHVTLEEGIETNKLVENLKQELTAGDKDRIHKAIDALNEYTRPFAERLMDAAIAHAMKGKKVD